MNEEKTALITGASRGIGRAISLQLADEGYNLYITCQHSEIELENTKKEILSRYPQIHCTSLLYDCSNLEQAKIAFQKIPSLDLLVNNAGVSHIGLLQDMSLEQWNQTLNTNLTSIFIHCKCCIPLMLQKHSGRIINISSVWGNVGASLEVAYSASKGGVNAFTKALAKELAPSNIQVNAISCGLIDTSMNAHLSKEEMSDLINSIPAGRQGSPDEVAKAVIMLASAPEYLTGQIITLDGSWI